ncbi:MAG TPA: hypothetical protein VKD23_19615, partial [Terriglobales bacterium]|nr:hypothetical protein [Terriglobales bacterium]
MLIASGDTGAVVRQAQPRVDQTEKPTILCRSIEKMACKFPYYDERVELMRFEEVDASVCAIRNIASTSAGEADDVIVHLDFVSAEHGAVYVNEA